MRREIPVGVGREMALLESKRTDPIGTFRTLGQLTADILAGRPFLVGSVDEATRR